MRGPLGYTTHMDLFNSFPHEPVTLVKQNGQRFENLSAVVTGDTIFTEDPKIPIEDGDEFIRVLPSGVPERYVITDAGFQHGFGNALPAHYQSKVRKSTKPAASARQQIVYNLVGANSRVNIQSSDSSTNVVNVETKALFTNVRQAVQQSGLDSGALQTVIERVDAMESSAGTKSFAHRYSEFIAAAANHATLITSLTPYLPALTQLLT